MRSLETFHLNGFRTFSCSSVQDGCGVGHEKGNILLNGKVLTYFSHFEVLRASHPFGFLLLRNIFLASARANSLATALDE